MAPPESAATAPRPITGQPRYLAWTEWRQPEPTSAAFTEQPAVRQRVVESPQHAFSALAEEWRRETAPLSSVTEIVLHPAYQRIIGMGPAVLPCILADLVRQPDHWFWALWAITGENPVAEDDSGNLLRMRAAWLRLGQQRGWFGWAWTSWSTCSQGFDTPAGS
jgi:hypothetical protein